MKRYNLILALLLAVFSAAAQQTTPKGLIYTLYPKGTGEKVKQGNVITFEIEQRTEKDSVLISSYKLGRPARAKLQPSADVRDMMEVFPLMAVNDSALIKVPVDSVFKGENESHRPNFLSKGSYVITRIKILKEQTLDEAMAEMKIEQEKAQAANAAENAKFQAAESAEAAKYIAANNLTLTTTASGLKYKITLPSAKRKPQNGDTVLVNYVGQTLTGKVFDSSVEAEAKKAGLSQPGRNYEPIQVVLGQGGVIKGWEEALLLLNEGAKAKLIIPSHLGYGERGAGADIKPFNTLVFDVELVKIKPAKRAVAAPAKTSVKKPLPKKKPAAKKTAPGKKKN